MAKKRTDEDIKNVILKTTSLLLETNSFSDISLNDISKKANISKGTIYYYYKNKEDIVFDVYVKYIDELSVDLTNWINDKSKDTSFHRIIKFVIQKGTDETSLRMNLINNALNGNEKLNNKMILRYNEFMTSFYNRLKLEMPDDDAKFLSWLLLLMNDGINIQKFMNNKEFKIEEFEKLAESYFKKTGI